jgi:predicted nucleic acid-binding protein
VTIVLDTGVLRLLITLRGPSHAEDCHRWFDAHLASGTCFVLPEIADYEERRTLLHRGRERHILRLEQLSRRILYMPITTEIIRRAAALWAEARRTGRKTADDKALDIDMILCAQVQILGERAGEKPVVATTNVAHLASFVDSAPWQEIALRGQ